MAILEDVGVEVHVLINGVPAVEHPVPDVNTGPELAGDKAHIYQKYVECVDNATYTIECTIHEHQSELLQWLGQSVHHLLCCCVYVDGTTVKFVQFGNMNSFKVGDNGKRQCLLQIRGKDLYDEDTGEKMMQAFRFSPISTVDDTDPERVEKDAELASRLGHIRVTITPGVFAGWKSLPKMSDAQKSAASQNRTFTLAEKSLKGRALSHGTTLDPPTRTGIARTKLINVDFGISSVRPYAEFNLLYRSQDALRREMIIPQLPTWSIHCLTVYDLPMDVVYRLAGERLEQMRRKKHRGVCPIKWEFDDTIDLTAADVPPRPLKTPN